MSDDYDDVFTRSDFNVDIDFDTPWGEVHIHYDDD